MLRVLFVCLGNICRSPMAEAIFQNKIQQAGLAERIHVDSAATGPWEVGNPPHPGTQRLLARKNIAYDHRARRLSRRDLNAFDYILTMDDANFADVLALGDGSAKVHRLLEYAPHLGVREVPDPYYTGNFEEVFRLLDAATDGLLEAIRSDLSPG